ncbi:hypothetical protein [Arcanobacterium phocae]|uniref:hypothetical protein n=1 Tax=Arcanobacterium phocae TaxID=131112 RepID=UPI001C0EF921|nr:hypothetical protein [Arcanobacterium phocae]
MRYATEAQINYIESLEYQLGVRALSEYAQMTTGYEIVYELSDLPRYQASRLIDSLKADLETQREAKLFPSEIEYTEADFEAMFDCLDC